MLIPPSPNKTSVPQHSNHLMEKHILHFFFVLSLVNFQQIHFKMKWKLAFHLDASAPFGWLGSGQHPLLSTPTWGWHHHNGYTHRVLGGSYHLAHWPWTHGRWLVSAPKGGRSWGILTPVCGLMCVCVRYLKRSTYNRYWIIDWDPLFYPKALCRLSRLWVCVWVCACVWFTMDALSLSMLNSALKCRSGQGNRTKSPKFRSNVHLPTV